MEQKKKLDEKMANQTMEKKQDFDLNEGLFLISDFRFLLLFF